MTAPAVPRETSRAKVAPPRPVATLDDILLELIDIDDNVRDDVGSLDELQASISELGVLSPVKVTTQADGRYRLVYGQRRVLACRALGRTRIAAIVEPPSEVDATGARRSIEQLAENLQRKDLNPIEEAVALREVLDADPTLTQEALADRLAMSRPWVSNTLRLLKVDPEVQARVRAGEISASHASAIAALPLKQQRDLAARVVSAKLSSHDLEREIKWKQDSAAQEKAKVKKTERIIPKVVAALEKAETSKTADISIHGPWDVHVDAVTKAVKAAGWKGAKNQYAYGGRPDGCDCTAVRVEISGRSPSLEPTCVDKEHQAKGRDADWAAREAEQEARRQKLAELRDVVRRDLDIARSRSMILRLLDWSLRGHWQETWEQQLARSDDDLLDSIADAVAVARDLDLGAVISAIRATQGPGNAGSGPGRARKAAE